VIPATYHKTIDRLVCHYCFRERLPLKECSSCHSRKLMYRGFGTEKIEAEVKAMFPGAVIARADSDTMKGRASYEELFDRFRGGEIDILIGTQMIAKGLDFPNVTLVGVLAADSALSMPDFRASERTFQLIAQVAGRAGRGDVEGEVVVQSFVPDHYSITCAAAHDYLGFYQHEHAFRRELGYPPFRRLVRIVVEGRQLDRVRKFSQKLKAELVGASGEGLQILGPAPAPIAYLKERHRWHLLVKCDGAPARRLVSDSVRRHNARRGAIRCHVDVDPYDMM